MSVSFAREDVKEEDDAEEIAGEDGVQYSKRIAETITKSMVIERDAIEGKRMATSTVYELEASIEGYMDATKPQTTREEEWMRRNHKKKKGLPIIELEPPYLKSERGRSGDMEVAYRKTELNSYCDTMENTDENDIWKKSENSYEKTKQNSYSGYKRKIVEKTVMKNKRLESKNETTKSRRREAVRSHSPFSLKRSSFLFR
jgi:hypothetical protein